MRLALFAAAGLLAAPAVAQKPATPSAEAPSGAYVMDPTHASLTWKMRHMGLSWYTARFTSFDIDLVFDPADVSKSKVSATLDPKSVETDFAKTRPAGNTTDFNAEIAERFLNAAKFPKVTFVSTSIKKTGPTTGTMTGTMTFLGVSKPETFEIAYDGHAPDFRPGSQKHKVAFTATGTIKRSDFGMPPGPLGDEVKITIESEFSSK